MGDESIDERRRYTSKLRQRAQAQVTAELGEEPVGADVDRQVAMLVQHALEATGARRVTLFRPVPRSQRWYTVTVLADGSYYYGLVAPDALVLPMVAFVERRPVLLGPDRPHEIPAPRLDELGFRSYLGLPLVADERVLAVLEAVDVAQVDRLDGYAETLQAAMGALAAALGAEVAPTPAAPAALRAALSETTVLDLVLRPPLAEDALFEVAADDWALLAHLDGNRTLAEAAAAADLPATQARDIAGGLLERGLLRVGPEDRRR